MLGFPLEDPPMSCTRLPKAAKPACFLICVMLNISHTTTSEIGSPLFLASNVLPGLNSEKAFNECLGVSNVYSDVAEAQQWLLALLNAMSTKSA